MHEDILLGFSSTRFPASRPVKECRPAKENGFVEIILEKVGLKITVHFQSMLQYLFCIKNSINI